MQFGGQTPLRIAAGLQEAGVQLLGTPVDAIDLAEDRGRFGALLDELGHPGAAVRRRARRRRGDRAWRAGSASRCWCGPRTSSAAARWRSVTPSRTWSATSSASGARWRAACTRCCSTASSRTRSSWTWTRSPTGRTCTSPGSCSTSRRPACTRATRHACCRRSASARRCSRRSAARRAQLALRLGVIGLLNVQFGLVDNDRLYVIEANPRASRTVPFVSKAIGVPLAKVACRLILGERLAAPGPAARAERRPREREGGGAAVPAPARRRRAAGPGDEVDRRGDGHRARLPDRVRQGAGRRRRGAALRGRGLHLASATPTSRPPRSSPPACTTSASACSRPRGTAAAIRKMGTPVGAA